MRILRSTDHRLMPWKNGGGETLEVAIFPPDASISDFGWRLSMARVAVSGPFSRFEGTDRILAVLEGTLVLRVEGRPDARLSPASAAHRFPGDAVAHAEVVSAVTDLNIMVRRGEFSADVRRLDRAKVTAHTDETFVLVRSNAKLATGQHLVCNDVLRLSPAESVLFDEIPFDAWLVEIQASSGGIATAGA